MAETALEPGPETTGRRLHVPVEVRWADTDQYGHVNNVALLRLAEEARIRTFGLPDRPVRARPDGEPPVLTCLGAGTFTVVAAQRVEYAQELAYDGRPLGCETWLSRIGSSSLDLDTQVRDADRRLCAILTVTLVVVDAATRRPRPLTATEVEHLSSFLGPGVGFR